MSNLPKINAQKYLAVSKEQFPAIRKEFSEIEEGKVLNGVQNERFQSKIKKVISSLKRIDTTILKDSVSKETLATIEDNINYMYEELLNIQNRLISNKYINDLTIPVRGYIRKMHLDDSDYEKWAKDEDALSKKFVGMLAHPKNLKTYKNHIKRIILGTMTQKEFRKIFLSGRYKMILLWKPKSTFESFKEYTK